MVLVLGCTAGVLFISALLLLAVDVKIYSNRGWVREKKYATLMGWTYCVLFLVILIGLLLYV
jgi:hypothetical protein